MSPDRSPQAGALTGREAAYQAVLTAIRGRGFAAEELRAWRAAGRLSAPDAGLAMEIALGTLRRLITIEHVLSAVAQFDKRRVRAPLRVILCAGAYQIVWMDRVPIFAAVDEAVEQATSHCGRRAAGMVNAILRRLSQAVASRRVPWQPLTPSQVRVSWEQACAFDRAVLPDAEGDPPGLRPTRRRPQRVAHLAAATGERRDRYQTLVNRYGPDLAEQVAWACQAVPVTVVHRNPLRCSPQRFRAELGAALGQDVDLDPDAAFVCSTRPVTRLPAFEEGLFYVQDTTAQQAASLVEAEPDQRILDLCAAPGGKSVALAVQMADRGEVVACDVSVERRTRIRENITRLGLTCVRISAPPAGPEDQSLGLFDAALVDVPCTNTGVLARRPEARFRLSRAAVDPLVEKQIELLNTAARHVRPGGRLVYSTCSLEPEENEQLVARFLAGQPDWELDAQQTVLPNWGPRLSDWRDGGFATRLLRR